MREWELRGFSVWLWIGTGTVSFCACPFYGRFMSEIADTLNDALRRLEGQTSYYIVDGIGDVLWRYYLQLKDGMTALRRDL